VAGLLYESARPYYDAYAGTEARARDLLDRVYPQPGHSASYELCTVAETAEGEVVGVLVAFPALDGDRLARKFVSLTLSHVPPHRWPAVLRHLRASSRVSPHPPQESFYVDALAVAEGARRQGVGRALIREAERQAREADAVLLALDTGIANDPARRLYMTSGFEETGVRRAPDERIARAVGGIGFVSYVKSLGA
jgi:ribosomal protein S18 acetylase RimI-like enzyme